MAKKNKKTSTGQSFKTLTAMQGDALDLQGGNAADAKAMMNKHHSKLPHAFNMGKPAPKIKNQSGNVGTDNTGY